MSIIDNYGEFDLPEEKSTIEVIEDPVKAILSYYDFFEKLIPKRMENIQYPSKIEKLYDEASKMFEGKENWNPDGQKIIEELKPKLNFETWDTCNYVNGMLLQLWTGIFLSAMHNKTSLKTLILDGFFDERERGLMDAGYRLKQNKTLVMGPKVQSQFVGQYAEGNIINYGKSQILCNEAVNGVHVNYYHINYRQYDLSFASEAKGGVQINNGLVNCMGLRSLKGVQINNGIKYQGEYYSHQYNQPNGIKISTRINNGEIKYGSLMYEIELKEPFMIQQKQKLDYKLKEIDFLKKLPEHSYEEQLKQIESFNFSKFQKEMTEIAEEIRKNYAPGIL